MKFFEADSDTIAAISTPPGEGGIGVIRLSGPRALAITDQIFESPNQSLVSEQKSHTAQYGHVVDKSLDGQGRLIDEVLVLLMRSPRSYTREDVVEISAHGGSATLKGILELAIRAGARLAAKGEFTKRAFLNGRIDLLQAEAVLDLVRAKTDVARQWAVSQLGGALSDKMRQARSELLDILSHLEAAVDFPDDAPETEPLGQSGARLERVLASLKQLLASAALGFIAKNGISIVIAGRPNVGKSSLMNQLVKTDRVIVTAFPGTTRDVVEDQIQIHGFPVRLSDTAGIQDTAHPIEKEGIERSKAAVNASELVLYVLDGSQSLSSEDRELIGSLGQRKKLIVINKIDLAQKINGKAVEALAGGAPVALVSCFLGSGIDELEKKIVELMTDGNTLVTNEPVISTVRQKDILEKACERLREAADACAQGRSQELVAADLRLALDHLGTLAGEVANEEVLELLFDQFCIGK